jgi:hypothetical protein
MKFLKTKKYSILSTFLKYSFVIVFGFMLFSPFVFADPTTGTGNAGPTTGTGTNINVKIENPLGTNGPQTIPDFIKLAINVVLVVGVPIAALAIIYTGFLFVQAQGNSEKLTKAKNALLYTLIGTALLLGAFVIANAIGKTVDEIKNTTT